jgi:hypothetical protein
MNDPNTRANEDHTLMTGLEALANTPTNVPELLRWLLGGPLTLDQLIGFRFEALALRHPNSVSNRWRGYDSQSVLFDLGRATSYVKYVDGLFHLVDRMKPAVQMYDRLAQHSTDQAPLQSVNQEQREDDN